MTKERVYVKVSSDFDSTGYMQPTSITWSDGRTFPIEKVRDFRPAGTADNGYSGDCFTVLIQGQEKHLFFEHLDPRFNGRLGVKCIFKFYLARVKGVRTKSWTKLLFLNYVYTEMDSFHPTIF